MPSFSWLTWSILLLGAYLGVSVTIDVLCRWLFSHRKIGGAGRPQPNIKPAKLAVLFVINTLQLSTALYLASVLQHRGWGGLYDAEVTSALDVLWLTLQVFFILVLYDTNFFWAHRLMHRYKKLFIRFHAEHHRPKYPNVWHLQYQHPVELFVTTISVMLVVALLPFSTQSYLIAAALAGFINIAGHCGFEITNTVIALPTFHGWAAYVDPQRRWIAKPFNNVLHHDLHHQHFRCNFALYFTWWDRLCGTFEAGSDDVSGYVLSTPETRPLVPAKTSSLPS